MIHHIAGITAAAPQTSRLPLEPLSLWRRRNWRWLVCVTSAGTGRWWQRRRLCKVAEDRPNADRQASEAVTCHPELANNLITQPLIHSGFSCKSFAVLWDVSEPVLGLRRSQARPCATPELACWAGPSLEEEAVASAALARARRERVREMRHLCSGTAADGVAWLQGAPERGPPCLQSHTHKCARTCRRWLGFISCMYIHRFLSLAFTSGSVNEL